MTLATIDLETDPFEYGKVPRPFAAGFWDGIEFIHYWGKDCVERILKAIASNSKGPYLIYAHNGGKFDFFYFMPYLSGDMRIVNGRIIQARLGESEIRDSYAIMPFPLKAYSKDDIDYEKMRAEVRESHRAEIISYLRKDCTALRELVVAFHEEFGDQLTVGSSALKQLRKRHTIKSAGAVYDERFRTNFYFGGRVEVFRPGIVHGNIEIYDVNSMYPFVMASCLHPIGTSVNITKRIQKNSCFVVAEGRNFGAFPMRKENGGLDFNVPEGRFYCSIHEWNAAEETGTFKPSRVVKTYAWDERITFEEFVYHFYGARKLADARGDKIHKLFYKYVLNSAYGKFAQNPENFSDYQILQRPGVLPEPWQPGYITNEYIIWKKPTEVRNYYNICTGASITGAARGILLRGLSESVNPIYCDTDSIICEGLRTGNISPDDLGAWKLEATGTMAAIAGKKMYAVIDSNSLFPCNCKVDPKECTVHVKKAHKGVMLTFDEVIRIAKGETIDTVNPVPSFKLDGRHKFITRRVKRTV